MTYTHRHLVVLPCSNFFVYTVCSRWTTQTTMNRASWSRVSWVRSTTPNRTWTWCSAAESPACRRVPPLRRRRHRRCPSPVWCNTTTRRHRRIPPRRLQPSLQLRQSHHTITPLPQWSANNSLRPEDPCRQLPVVDPGHPLSRRPLRNRPSRRMQWLGRRHPGAVAAAVPLPRLIFSHPRTHPGTYHDCSILYNKYYKNINFISVWIGKNRRGNAYMCKKWFANI